MTVVQRYKNLSLAARRWITVLAVLGLLLLGIRWGLEKILPYFLDYPALQAKIQSQIQKSTGIQLKTETLAIKPTLTQGIQVVLATNVVRDPKDLALAEIGKIEVHIRYWPLLTSGVQDVSKLHFDHMTAYLEADSYFFQIKPPPPAKGEVQFHDTEILLTDYALVANRSIDPKNRFRLAGKRFSVKHIESDQPLDISARGTLFLGGAGTQEWPLSDFQMRAKVAREFLIEKKVNPAFLNDFSLNLANVNLDILARTLQAHRLNRPGEAAWVGEGALKKLNVTYRNAPPRLPLLKVLAVAGKKGRFGLGSNVIPLASGILSFQTSLEGILEGRFRERLNFKYLILALDSDVFHGRLSGNVEMRQPLQRSRVDLHLETETFSVSLLHELPESLVLGQLIRQSTGQIRLDAKVRGLVSAPNLTGSLWMKDFGVSLARLWPDGRQSLSQLKGVNGQIRLEADRLELNKLRGQLDGSSFAVNLSYDKVKAWVKGNLQVSSLDLARLTTFVRELADAAGRPIASPVASIINRFGLRGMVSVNARFDGPLKNPAIHGRFDVSKGELYAVSALEKPILNRVTGSVLMEGNRVRLPRMVLGLHEDMITLAGTYQIPQKLVSATLNGEKLHLDRIQASLMQVSEILGKPLTGLRDVAVSGQSSLHLVFSGPITRPVYTGTLNLAGVQVSYKSRALSATQLNGKILLTPSQILLETLQGRLDSTRFTVKGFIAKTFDQYRLQVVSNDVDIQRFYREVASRFPELSGLAEELRGISGSADLMLTVVPGPKAPAVFGDITVNRFKYARADLPFPLEVGHLVLRLKETGEIWVDKANGHFGKLAFSLEGAIRNGAYDVRLATERVSLSFLRDQQGVIKRLTHLDFPDLWNTSGEVRLAVRLASDHAEGTITFYDAGASWEGGDFPLYHLNGTLTFSDGPSLHSDRLTFKYGNSPFVTQLDYRKGGQVRLDASGSFSPLVINHYLIPRSFPQSIQAYVPFQLQTSGSLRTLGNGGSGNNLAIETELMIPKNLTVRNQQNPEVEERVSFKPAEESATANEPYLATLSSRLALVGDRLEVKGTELNLFNSGKMLMTGYLDNLFSREDWVYSFRVLTDPEVDLSKLDTSLQGEFFQGATGTVAADFNVHKAAESEGTAQGFLKINNLSVPQLDLLNLTASVDFEDIRARMQVDSFRIPGADLQIRAMSENIFEYPIKLENVSIQGRQFVVTQFSDFLSSIVIPKVQNRLLENIYAPPRAWEPWFPVEFRNAPLALDEVVYQNIILENFNAQLSLFGNGYTEMNQVHFRSAGGNVTGHLSMNPRDNNFLSLVLEPEGVKANALARALLNAPNTIFGDLSGMIQVTTRGMTQEDMIRNTNGTASFYIKNGRLPAIARLETLLTAVNILRGGVVGLNLNNIIRSLKPFETNYFSELSGDFQIAGGTAYTNNLLSDGENLDLLIGGSIHMLDATANLKVIGSMSQDVSGALGVLGKLSIGRLVSFIPGVGYIPGRPRGGLLKYLPGIGYIPGFGGPAEERNRFQVFIRGPLDDPGSVKDFEWL